MKKRFKDQMVSFETAKLAKEKGFNEECERYFTAEGDMWTYHYWGDGLNSPNHCFRPTQSLLQKWLRDKHGIGVVIDIDITLAWTYKIFSMYPEASFTGQGILSNYCYSTYEMALEPGLSTALSLIN